MTVSLFSKFKQRGNPKTTSYATLMILMAVAMMVPFFFTIPVRATTINELSILSFIVIGVYSFVMLYFSAKSRAFTLDCAHWVFVFFFFFYAPFAQYLADFPPFQANIGAFKKYHLETNLLILLWCVGYTLTYKVSCKITRKPQIPQDELPEPVAPNYALLCFLSILAVLMIAAIMGSGGFISRGTAGAVLKKKDEAKTTFLIANTFCRALPAMALAQILVTWRGRKTGAFAALVITGIATLACNHFLTVPRFWFGTIWIGFVCVALRNRRMTAFWLPASLCAAFIYVMPFLNISRATDVDKINLGNQRVVYSVVRVLVSGDFDAYTMYANTLKYVQDKDLTYGNQVLGSVLFFVPRTMWKDKPDGSSGLIANRYHTRNRNLSEPLPAEGYIDFGVLGTFFYAIGFAFILARLDTRYWNTKATQNADAPTFINLIYPFLIGMVVFIMRGSLNSSFAYACGLMAAGWCTQKIAFFGRKKTRAKTFLPPRSLAATPVMRSAQ